MHFTFPLCGNFHTFFNPSLKWKNAESWMVFRQALDIPVIAVNPNVDSKCSFVNTRVVKDK